MARSDLKKLSPTDPGDFESLVAVVAALRGPDGCPWDKEQTLDSLARYAIEEACEYAQAVDKKDTQEMISELGDVLLQVVLNSEVARQEGKFTLRDVIAGISHKMVSRHPHVFADVSAETSDEVLKNWDQIKAKEKDSSKKKTRAFDDIPASMPALMRAAKIGSRTKKENFDWKKASHVFAQVESETDELKKELKAKKISKAQVAHEIGDLLFSIAQLARHCDLDPEQTLRQANERFTRRYTKMREILDKQGYPKGLKFETLPAEKKEIAWKKVKSLERQ